MLNGNTYNEIKLKGFVARDPQFAVTPSGTQVATFVLGTTRNQNGEKVVDWHRVVAFGKLAEVVNNYVKKNKQVFVIGYLKYNHINSNDDTAYKIAEVVANAIFLMDSPRQESNGSLEAAPAEQKSPATQEQVKAASEDDLIKLVEEAAEALIG